MNNMDYPKRGQIWLSALDPAKGHEIKKTRSALIISQDMNNKFAPTLTLIPMTSKIGKVFIYEMEISKEESGLSKNSKFKCNQIRTVDKNRLIKHLSTISEEKMKEVENALLIHLGMY
ncbi:MAG: type II toxin-antitoxin system PemK/MazF family toxin [Armatimonadota bacterium]